MLRRWVIRAEQKVDCHCQVRDQMETRNGIGTLPAPAGPITRTPNLLIVAASVRWDEGKQYFQSTCQMSQPFSRGSFQIFHGQGCDWSRCPNLTSKMCRVQTPPRADLLPIPSLRSTAPGKTAGKSPAPRFTHRPGEILFPCEGGELEHPIY